MFSDIEGSTARWENARSAMSAALARHDTLIRSAIEDNGGFVFKTVGDAFCAAFSTAAGAVAAARSAQGAIAVEDFSAVGGLAVRIALHTGAAEQRDGDYFGSTVNRVARLLAAAHGGQVLVSGACAELLAGELAADCTLRDLGSHRLKDLARPEHVFQLIVPGLTQAFPPLRTLETLTHHNLPAQLTTFVGRESVVSEITRLVETHRLVTLVGTGGAGKTRCAIQVGADLLDGSGDGVWLAELARISDASLVAGVIARAVGVPEEANRPMLDTLLSYLKRKHLLLIVDNCEHLIDEARRVVAAILHACPDVYVLATSREGLNVEGEQLYHIPSLATPPPHETSSVETLRRFGAFLLFIDRANAVDSRFSVNDENAAHIAEICRRLDGIPLAIELAAARTKVLSPQQLAEKLNERFRLLTGGDRTVLPRHQTMQALIDWSYGLLSHDERALFRKLSVFPGTFNLASASAVCCDATLDEIAILDLLASLVDKSLVQTEQNVTGTRYRMLESTREYARALLTQHGEWERVARAHAAAFLAEAEELDAAYEALPDRAWGIQAELEMDNWRAALEWGLAAGNDVRAGRRIACALRWVWMFFAPAEGLNWVRFARETACGETPDRVIATLDLALAELNITLSQYHASYEASAEAFTCFESLADERGLAEAGWALGRSCIFIGLRSEGEERLSAALELAKRLRLRKILCWILPALSQRHIDGGNLDRAGELQEEALSLARAISFDRMIAVLVGLHAELRYRRGEVEAAVQLAREAVDAARVRNDRRTVMVDLANLSAYLTTLGRYDEARTAALEGLMGTVDSRAAVQICFNLQHLAAIAAFESCEYTRAAKLLGYTDARLQLVQGHREYTEQSEYDIVQALLRQHLGDAHLEMLMRDGSAWTEDEAVAEALLV